MMVVVIHTISYNDHNVDYGFYKSPTKINKLNVIIVEALADFSHLIQ